MKGWDFLFNFVLKFHQMSVRELESVKAKYYAEAKHYMENARTTLKAAGKEDRYYSDDKYVRTACGTAYLAVLKAIDGIFKIAGITRPKGRLSIEYYKENASKLDKKLVNLLGSCYNILHLDGYYDGITSVKVISAGFEDADEIVNMLGKRIGE